MVALVPPQHRVLFRAKALKCASACVLFALLAALALGVLFHVGADLAIWVLWVGMACAGVALLTAIGTVACRIFETPQEVSVPDYRKGLSVIHLNRKD
jgi:hypothetical protein